MRRSSDFVADYAAKRNAQLEHAKLLRELRGKSTATTSVPPTAPPPPPAERPAPDVPPVGSARLRSASTAARMPATAPTGGRAEVAVTEADFRRATQLGIITGDQARQLWAVLSAQATTITPESTQPPSHPHPSLAGLGTHANENANAGYGGHAPHAGGFHPSAYHPSAYSPAGSPLGSALAAPAPKTALQRLADDPPPSRGDNRRPGGKPTWNADVDVRNESPPRETLAPLREKPQAGVREAKGDKRTPAHAPPPSQTPSAYNAHAARSNAARGRGGKAEPPPEPMPVQPSAEEVEEFERQREEQRRHFEDALGEADDSEPLVECRVCERSFRSSVIGRHEAACKRVNRKRKVFDMKGQRWEGVEGAEEFIRQQQRRPAASGKAKVEKPAGKMPKWKLQHEQFQAAIAAMRGGKDGATSGPPLPTPEALDDRVPCPHCGRKFAQQTAERHIPKCTSINAKPKPLLRPPRR